jgi:hypothetical protein
MRESKIRAQRPLTFLQHLKRLEYTVLTYQTPFSLSDSTKARRGENRPNS